MTAASHTSTSRSPASGERPGDPTALLALVAPSVVCVVDIIAVARGASYRELHVRSTVPGYSSVEAAWMSDGRGIHVSRSPHGAGTVAWAAVRDLIAAGSTPVLVGQAKARHRLYSAICTEDPGGWCLWPSDSVHAARLDAHQARYSRTVRAMQAVVRRVVERGLAGRATQMSLLDPQ